MKNQMDLQNNYSVMYNAPERVTEEAPNQVYAFKPASEGVAEKDAMVITYDNAGTAISLKNYKLIYCDGEHLRGSLTGIPAADDVNILVKTADGELVFGKVIED